MGRVGVSENGGEICVRLQHRISKGMSENNENNKLPATKLSSQIISLKNYKLSLAMMRRIILHICRHQTSLQPTFNILKKNESGNFILQQSSFKL